MRRRRAAALAGLAVLLAVPRVVRMLFPQVWIEDDSYLHGAFLLARGFRPYVDFPLPHLPLLEALMAAVFSVAPISIRTAEAFTQIAAYVGSLLVFSVGRRMHGAATGVAASLVFATSALLFRYHVFEREVFVVVPVLGAFLLLLPREDGADSASRALAAGVLGACALAVKLTAASACVAIVAGLWLEGRRRTAALFAVTATVISAGVSAVLAARYGTDFVVQVFVFRLVHATFPSLGTKIDEVRYSMDISLAFGAAGVAFIVWRRETRRWSEVLLQLGVGTLTLVALNPTFWAHTGIELLPWLSLAAGRLIGAAVDAVSDASNRRPAMVCAAAAIALLVYAVPVRNVNWEAGDGSVYGFGYRDRAELDAAGAFVRGRSAPDAAVATPPIIAFIANRAEVIPYPEIAGTVDDLASSVRTIGYVATMRNAAGRDLSFWDSVEASRDRMQPRLEAALAAHRVAVLINDSPDDLLAVPLVHLAEDDLEAKGYQLGSVWAHYEAWLPR